MECIKIDGLNFPKKAFSSKGITSYNKLLFSMEKLNELHSQRALLLRAKNGYISDLKLEISHRKSGVNLGALFSEE